MNGTDRDVTLTFVSVATRVKADGWWIKLTIPAHAGPNDDLILECLDGEEKPLDEGTFHFAGGVWKFKGGRARISYARFLAGIHERELWFRRPGGQLIPGGLTVA